MKRILGIGNALVDILVKLPSEDMVQHLGYPKGSMQLITSKELDKISSATFKMEKNVVEGGSASNTMIGLSRLGSNSNFLGKIGKDETGESFKKCLINNGITPNMLTCDKPSGRCHVLISPDSERTMCTFLGAAEELLASDLNKELFEGYDLIHIEGYLVQNYELMMTIGKLAKECGAQLSIDLASFNIVAENIDFLNAFVDNCVDILFANEEEAHTFTNLDAEQALLSLAKRIDTVIVKVGARGSYAITKGSEAVFISAKKVNCIDTTGAGDLYAAGFLHAFSNNFPLNECIALASRCAEEVIQVLGAKVPNDKWNDIKKTISK